MNKIGDRFWRSIGLVLSGTVFAQAIPLLGSLLIARLYVPAEFGVFATWLGMAQLAAVAMTGRYEMALAMEPDGEQRRVGVLATFATAGIGTLVLVSAASFLYALEWLPRVSAGLLLSWIPAAALLCAAQIWQAWAAADGRYRELGLLRIAQALSVTALQVVLGTLVPSAEGLAWGQVVGLSISALVAIKTMSFTVKLSSPTNLIPAMRSFQRRHYRFPLLSLPADSVNTAAAQLPLIIVTSRFGAEVAGWLAMAMRSLGAPISLLGAAVLDVFRRHAAQAWRDRGNCRAEYLQTLRVLAGASAAVGVVLAMTSEPLFALVFGERWRAAGTVALWMLPMYTLRFVASPLSYLFYVGDKQHIDLIWQLALLVMTACTLTLAVTSRAALLAYSAGYSGLYLVYLYLSYRLSGGAHS